MVNFTENGSYNKNSENITISNTFVKSEVTMHNKLNYFDIS